MKNRKTNRGMAGGDSDVCFRAVRREAAFKENPIGAVCVCPGAKPDISKKFRPVLFSIRRTYLQQSQGNIRTRDIASEYDNDVKMAEMDGMTI